MISRTEAAGASPTGADDDDDDDDDEFQDDYDDDDDDGFDFSEVATAGGGSDWSRLSSASSGRGGGSIEEEDIKEAVDRRQIPLVPARLDPSVSALPGVRKVLKGGKDKAKREAAGIKAAREVEELLGSSGAEGASAGLLDGDELDDWGLDELAPRARVSKVWEGGHYKRKCT